MVKRMTAAQVDALGDAGRADLLRRYYRAMKPIDLFRPRPDSPEDYDEQTAFVKSDPRKTKFAICLGGTGSGKTIAAAYKTAKFILGVKPHRDALPFWIIGATYEQTCAVCWQQVLSKFIPADMIKVISWIDRAREWPAAVLLKHPDDPRRIGWILEFKSFKQGRERMQGRSIGGFWFNEECPLDIVRETLGRTRDYDSPGWADFTPVSAALTEWPDLYDQPPSRWQFFHLNVGKNTAVPEGGTKPISEWAKEFLSYIPEDERETRRIGVFTSFSGQVFKEFRRSIHVLDPVTAKSRKMRSLATRLNNGDIPSHWLKLRGVDFGYSTPFACVWVCKDDEDRWYVYDEHHEASRLISYHCARIVERTWDERDPNYGQTLCDSSRPESIKEMQDFGIRAVSAQSAKEPGSILRRISFMRHLMMLQPDGRPKLYMTAKCVNLIREMRGYHWRLPIGKDQRQHDSPFDLPVKFDDHCIDAMCYAIYSAAKAATAPQVLEREWQPRASVQFRAGVERIDRPGFRVE